MTSATFNAISYATKLEQAGLARKIADVHAEELSELINNGLVMKADLLATENTLRAEMREMEYRLIIRLGAMMFVCAGLVVSLIKLL